MSDRKPTRRARRPPATSTRSWPAIIALADETERLRLDADTLREGIRALLESRAPGRYWVAELDGRVVGQLLITFEWSDWRNRMVWWIQSVYVVPEARGRGVLRTLYDVARARGHGGRRGRPTSVR